MTSEIRVDCDDDGDEPSIAAVGTESPLAGLTLQQIEQQVLTLPNGLTVDRLLQWLDLSYVLLARAKEIRDAVEDLAIKWINNYGPITIGNMHYSISSPSVVRCVQPERCLDLLLGACGGDLAEICRYFRADPYKYGAVRELLGEEVFEDLFRVEARPKLVGGKPQKQLKRTDQRFVR